MNVKRKNARFQSSTVSRVAQLFHPTPTPALTVTNYIDKVRVYVRKSGALLSTLSATRERYSLHGPGA